MCPSRLASTAPQDAGGKPQRRCSETQSLVQTAQILQHQPVSDLLVFPRRVPENAGGHYEANMGQPRIFDLGVGIFLQVGVEEALIRGNEFQPVAGRVVPVGPWGKAGTPVYQGIDFKGMESAAARRGSERDRTGQGRIITYKLDAGGRMEQGSKLPDGDRRFSPGMRPLLRRARTSEKGEWSFSMSPGSASGSGRPSPAHGLRRGGGGIRSMSRSVTPKG